MPYPTKLTISPVLSICAMLSISYPRAVQQERSIPNKDFILFYFKRKDAKCFCRLLHCDNN